MTDNVQMVLSWAERHPKETLWLIVADPMERERVIHELCEETRFGCPSAGLFTLPGPTSVRVQNIDARYDWFIGFMPPNHMEWTHAARLHPEYEQIREKVERKAREILARELRVVWEHSP